MNLTNGYKKEYVGKMPVTGKDVYAHSITNGKIGITVLDYGATLQKFVHKGVDLVCGYDTVDGYVHSDGYVGATVGRYANRISGALVTIDGIEYPLDKNEGENQLHGGADGFHNKYWYVEDGLTHEGWPCLCCGLISYEGESGYPGRMHISINYILKNQSLIIDYRAETTKPTLCNMTNHSYFNLKGYDKPGILDHKVTVFADRYTVTDPETLIPTGERRSVEGTAMDFRTEKEIGRDLANTGLPYPGYDHNFVLDHRKQEVFEGVKLNLAAVVRVPEREMTVLTSMPCMQMYTANFLGDGCDFKGGVKQEKYHGVCFETQYEPDSPKQGLAILRPGTPYRQITVYRIK